MPKKPDKPWVMPGWMKRYEDLIYNTDGEDIATLVNRDASFSVDTWLAARKIAVKSQVILLERLHENGWLRRESIELEEQ